MLNLIVAIMCFVFAVAHNSIGNSAFCLMFLALGFLNVCLGINLIINRNKR